MAACYHPDLRTYEFHCDGALYLAIECKCCPASTSLLIKNPSSSSTGVLAALANCSSTGGMAGSGALSVDA
jgi:hypothetical protein